ncbi:alkylation response protein AidB-like acyl-CoA dehydrogenase [Pseudochelatococcus lubricantis]|uniref:Dibenzothiophene monooxygenase n=1 Tax=Pseudochelatococcus lubricantis TaxID=1538102 RepID=A0ABX0V311_9HYPH|nr:acyl-CoA dehydrogenase family protein [Pseudochelatococcus lubricantis]NIJ58963.1 alkylation response protein AidB-like acyl-CoA dehydrogenase [Pseudochelatococcus lubricantis]
MISSPIAVDIASLPPAGAASASPPRVADILARVPALAAEIAKGAARRDQTRELPFEAFRLIREAGIGTLRIPAALGGPGGTVENYIDVIARLAAADSNVAHSLRSHFNFTETLALDPEGGKARRYLDEVLAGKLFAGAHTELGTARPGDVTTRLTSTPAGWRLNGRKWYATGTAFADYATFSAKNDADEVVSVLIPVGRAGIAVLDDWDGMGQRLTASGGVLLDDVEVFEDEISARALDGRIGRHTSTLRQLHLAASAAGAVRAVLNEGIAYVRDHARPAAHSPAASAREDHFIQELVGEIAAASFAVDALVAESARALDRSAAAFAAGDEAVLDAALVESALTTSRTQIVASRLALRAAEQIFDLGGASTTSSKYNFDRHWRNIRTVFSHNPLLHKARVVGDYYLNGTTTHLREGKVF